MRNVLSQAIFMFLTTHLRSLSLDSNVHYFKWAIYLVTKPIGRGILSVGRLAMPMTPVRCWVFDIQFTPALYYDMPSSLQWAARKKHVYNIKGILNVFSAARTLYWCFVINQSSRSRTAVENVLSTLPCLLYDLSRLVDFLSMYWPLLTKNTSFSTGQVWRCALHKQETWRLEAHLPQAILVPNQLWRHPPTWQHTVMNRRPIKVSFRLKHLNPANMPLSVEDFCERENLDAPMTDQSPDNEHAYINAVPGV